jgi:hypothetical protein
MRWITPSCMWLIRCFFQREMIWIGTLINIIRYLFSINQYSIVWWFYFRGTMHSFFTYIVQQWGWWSKEILFRTIFGHHPTPSMWRRDGVKLKSTDWNMGSYVVTQLMKTPTERQRNIIRLYCLVSYIWMVT